MTSAESSPTPKRRRWLRWLGGAALLGAITLAIMPLWWPWLLVPVLERQGVSVAGYEREGISRLDLRGVGFTNAAVEVTATSLVAQLPHRWLLDRFGWSDPQGPAQMGVTGLKVRVLPATPTNQPPATNSLASVLGQTSDILGQVRPWLSRVVAWDGEFDINNRTTRVESLELLKSSLVVKLSDPGLPAPAEVSIRFPRPSLYELEAGVPDRNVRSEFQLLRSNGEWQLDGEVHWQTNRVAVQASVGQTGWLPASFIATGTNWVVPAGLIGLEGYHELAGGFDVAWTNGQYQFSVLGSALPTINNPLVPDRIEIDVAGLGNLEALAVERLSVWTPALQARLSDPLAIDFTGRMLVPTATLQVSADFIPADGLPFTGKLEGTVTARPALDDLVNAEFAVQMNEFASDVLNVDQLNLDGALHWPQLVISNGYFSFPDAGTFRMNGELNLLSRALGNVNWTYAGALPTNVVPAGLAIGAVNARGTVAGIWPDLTHHTEALATKADWNGSRADEIGATMQGLVSGTNQWELRLKHGDLSLKGAGAVNFSTLAQATLKASINELQIAPTTNSSLRLTQPVEAEASWVTNTTARFSARLTPLKLTGSGKLLDLSADIHWPAAGRVTLTATNITTGDFAGLWAEQLPEVAVRDLLLTAAWEEGPLTFSAVTDLAWSQPVTGTLDARVRMRGGAAGVELSPTTLSTTGSDLVTVSGRLPIAIVPDSDALWQWLDEGVFDLRLDSQADAPLWNRLANDAGLALTEPRLSLVAKGDLDSFHAEAEFSTRSVRALQFTNLPPETATISNLQLHASATLQELALRDGSFVVAGQPATFSARFPLTARNWNEWMTELQRPNWRKVAGELIVPAIDVARLVPLLDSPLAPVGQASIEVRLAGDGGIRGFATVTNLATRPLEPLGSLRDIQGRIEFDDRQAQLKSFSAMLSGQPVRAGGKAAWDAGGLTNAEVFLQATNISLVRSVDLFLRGDLDLRVTSDGKSPPRISGDVNLNDSLLFQDIGNLVAIDLKQPARRPPFFSVPEPPLADWRLDVRVRGQKFLRVLSPVFKGHVSTGLQLSGSLKEPVALGEVSIEKGQMLFPFGSLDVTRGVVQLTRQDPHLPRVDLRGQGLNFGYNISVAVTGTAEAPAINFTSVPPLTTREIILMLTAGEIPSGAYSYTDVDKASKLGYFLSKELINQLLGMDSGEEKLIFRTGEYVTDDGQLTYRIEYKLIDWLSVFGEYTRFRDYNGGFKFNLYSK